MNVLNLAATAIVLIAGITLGIAHAAGDPPAGQGAAAVQAAGQPVPAGSANLPVLDRFRTYTGKRTPAALSELFAGAASSRVRQQPEIVLSSGAVSIAIAVAVATQNGTAPNFAFNGARLISYEQTSPDAWLIEALPETGVWRAEMIVLTDSAVLEVPLVVAPPLPAETDLSEKGFIRFLGGGEPGAKPLTDLNGDGHRDYLDDYIFTANYLVRKNSPVQEQAGEPPAGAEEPVADQPGEAQHDPAAGTPAGPQPPASAQEPVTQAPVTQASDGAQTTADPPAGKSTAPPAQAVSRETYNSLNYVQKKKLRGELARKNRQQIDSQGQ